MSNGLWWMRLLPVEGLGIYTFLTVHRWWQKIKKYMQQVVNEMNKMMSSVTSNIIAVMGFAFKENTDDNLIAQSWVLSQTLLSNRLYHLKIYDPRINDQNLVRSYFVKGLGARVILVNNVVVADHRAITIYCSYFIRDYDKWIEFVFS